MKPLKSLIYCSVIFLISLSACKLNDKKNKEGASSSNTEKPSEKKADAIISYTNKVVDVCNDYTDFLKRTDDYLLRCDKGLKNYNDQFAFIHAMSPFFINPITKTKESDIVKPISDLSDEDQKFFQLHCSDIVKFKTLLVSRIDSLKSYIKAEDYKDDKGAKGGALVQSAYTDYDTIQSIKHLLLKKIEVVADASEKVLLEKNPLKNCILNMKEDMRLARDFADFFHVNFNQLSKVIPQIDEKYKALEDAYNKHKDAETDKLSKPEYTGDKASYNNFYNYFNDLLGEARKTIREAKEKGKVTDSDVNTLFQNADYLVSPYNNFDH